MKTKKLTALMSAVMLAVCGVPMGAGAEKLMGDANGNGIIDDEDVKLLYEYVLWSGDYGDRYTDEEKNFMRENFDVDGDGEVTIDDVVLLGESSDGDITLNTEMGDVNHDGFINAVDASMVLIYYANLSTNNSDKYTEAQHENFKKYGDVSGDGRINAIDAAQILVTYAEKATELPE